MMDWQKLLRIFETNWHINNTHVGQTSCLSACTDWKSVLCVIVLLGLGICFATMPVLLIGSILAGTILLTLILIQPKLCLYLLIPIIPFSSFLQLEIGEANLTPMEPLIGLMLISWLLRKASKQAIVIPHPPLLFPFMIFLGGIGFSWLTMTSITSSVIETIKWIEMLIIYLFIVDNLSLKDSRRIVGLILFMGVTQAGLGIYQFVTLYGPPEFMYHENMRAYGSFNQPNPFAGYMGLILPLAFSVMLWQIQSLITKIRTETWYFGKIKFLITSIITILIFWGMSYAMQASQSRGAWIGAIVAIAVTVFLHGRWWTIISIVGIIGMVIADTLEDISILPDGIIQRFESAIPYIGLKDISTISVRSDNISTVERLAHWHTAQNMWADHKWLGIGFGNYQTVYPDYAIGRWIEPLGHAHNYILNLGAEIGFLGLLSYIILWLWVIIFAMRTLMSTKLYSFNRTIVAGSIGIITHLHLHNFVDNLYVQGMYLHIAIILGLITLVWKDCNNYDDKFYRQGKTN